MGTASRESSTTVAVCLLEQIRPSLIVAARRRAAVLAREALPPAGQRSTDRDQDRILGLTMLEDIARLPPGNPSLRLV
jgi:hypothetical protein